MLHGFEFYLKHKVLNDYLLLSLMISIIDLSKKDEKSFCTKQIISMHYIVIHIPIDQTLFLF